MATGDTASGSLPATVAKRRRGGIHTFHGDAKILARPQRPGTRHEKRARPPTLPGCSDSQAVNTTAACRRIGEELGINSDTLRGWVKRAQVDSGKRPGTTSGDAARIRQLERENAELRRANAILRTASAFFASELGHH